MNRIILLLTAQLFFQSLVFADHSFQDWIDQTEEATIALLQERTLKEGQYLKMVEEAHFIYQSNSTFANYIKYQDAKEKLQFVILSGELDQLQLRYQRGLSLIKLLYEKVLSLDHHFTGMRTFQNIFRLANPNSYPEFRDSKAILEEHLNKRSNFKLPEVLAGNLFVSTTYSLVSSFLSEMPTKSNEQQLEEIACILDFTLQMNDDLNLIQFETQYLKGTNTALIKTCEELFAEYVKVIDYHVALSTCRKEDDWEDVYAKLDSYMLDLHQNLEENQSTGIINQKLNRSLVNLEFETQRVAKFVDEYESFISMGSQYYQKFDSIISNYQNAEICAPKLPSHFDELQYDIQNTIDKFQNTYNLPEIAGSRMKSLLYGIN